MPAHGTAAPDLNAEQDEYSPFAPPPTDYTPFAADEGPSPAFEEFESAYSPELELELEPPYLSEDEASPASLRSRTAAIARQELQRWNPGGVKRKETDARMTDTLRAYWTNTVSAKDAESLIRDRAPWSSAFVSWVMRQAGAGNSFKHSTAHRVYVGGGKKARAAGDASKFWAYRISEARPEVGDIVVAERQSSAKVPCGSTTYDNVDDGSARATHGDVVIEVRSDAIDVVGGNVADSVTLKTIKLDPNGFVAQPNGCKFFAIMKPPGVAAPTGAPVAAAAPSVTGGGMVSAATAIALVNGDRDEGRLTNLTFLARHPELPTGYRIRKEDTQLVNDWMRTRDGVIRPLIRALPPR